MRWGKGRTDKICRVCGRRMINVSAARKTCVDCQQRARNTDRRSVRPDPPPKPPPTHGRKDTRNRAIAERRQSGESLESIGRAYGITKQRALQICRDEKHRKGMDECAA